MNFKYYTFRSPPMSVYDIPHNPDVISEQKYADQAIIQALFRFASKSKPEVLNFLNYQLNGSPEFKSEFIGHFEKVFKANYFQLNPYKPVIQTVLDWIAESKLKFPPDISNDIVKDYKTSSKLGESFDDVIIDYPKMEKILNHLVSRRILLDDHTWMGIKRGSKLELIAFLRILVDARIIVNDSHASLGRIFSTKFSCEMHARNYSAKIKNDIYSRVRNELNDFI